MRKFRLGTVVKCHFLQVKVTKYMDEGMFVGVVTKILLPGSGLKVGDRDKFLYTSFEKVIKTA